MGWLGSGYECECDIEPPGFISHVGCYLVNGTSHLNKVDKNKKKESCAFVETTKFLTIPNFLDVKPFASLRIGWYIYSSTKIPSKQSVGCQ